MDKNDANLIRYYIISPPHLDENRPNNNLDNLDNGRLSPPSRKITDKLDLTNDLLAMTLDSLDSLDGPTEADLFGDDNDIFGDSVNNEYSKHSLFVSRDPKLLQVCD